MLKMEEKKKFLSTARLFYSPFQLSFTAQYRQEKKSRRVKSFVTFLLKIKITTKTENYFYKRDVKVIEMRTSTEKIFFSFT